LDTISIETAKSEVSERTVYFRKSFCRTVVAGFKSLFEAAAEIHPIAIGSPHYLSRHFGNHSAFF
jgi:hypothetical protein